ncbi:glycosyltransferase family 2 protein [Psychroserpens sp. XS_ASV72]|uniref:glycosyltransferase family 2 protein n=1 Tax=Psychroserpens sp. XS_ASV72 TaxID=3241293 RepID=UPI0035197ADE
MVSIIIPYYNRPKKLQRAIDSVFEQTFTDYEIIVVDDCSEIPPKTITDNRIAYLKNDENKGPGFSRNYGMSVAKGDYIVFLDTDDYWHKDFLKQVIAALKNNQEAIMAYANGYYVNESGTAVEEMRLNAQKLNTILPNIFIDGRPWGTAACVWDRHRIKDVKWVDTRCWEDYVFDTSCAVICNTVEFVDEALVYYDMSNDEFKLSAQKDFESIEKNRNISLLHISRLVANSPFTKDQSLKQRLIHYAYSNAIALLKLGVKKKKYFKNLKAVIKSLGGKSNRMNITFLLNVETKISLKLLRRLRQLNLQN